MTFNYKYFFTALAIVIGFWSCETEITIDLPKTEETIVVEGWIETDGFPFVLLTQNLPYFGSINLDTLNDFFVEDAIIDVSNGTDTMRLEAIQLDTAGQTVVAYGPPLVDIFTGNAFVGEAGKTYSIKIQAEGQTVTGKTYIPHSLPIDSIWWEPRFDTMARVFISFTDPDTTGNLYRYFTQIGDEPMYPGLASTFDDLIINGQNFTIPVDRGYNRFGEIDFETFGLFPRGDTVAVRISAVDKEHYDFWLTIESNAQSGGPFSPLISVDHNVENGFGVFGGYNVQELEIFIPE